MNYLSLMGYDKNTIIILSYTHKFTAGTLKQPTSASTTPFQRLIDKYIMSWISSYNVNTCISSHINRPASLIMQHIRTTLYFM